MYTIVSVTVVSDSKEKADLAIEKAFDEIRRIEKLINFYSPTSEVSLINKYAGIKPVKVSKETLEIIKKAIYVSDITNGAFDATIGPLVKLWDFHRRVIPDKKKIYKAKKYVGYKNIVIDEKNSTVYLKKKGMYIDLGGIAKGYTADKIVEILKKSGIKSGIVAVGGDIKAFGRKPDGSPWIVGVRHPRSENRSDVIATLYLEDKAISTAGDYERYFIIDSKRYHHILDPATGYPATESISVTVISDNGYLADGLSTGFFVLGPEKSLTLARKYKVEVIIVDKKLNLYHTDNIPGLKIFKEKLQSHKN